MITTQSALAKDNVTSNSTTSLEEFSKYLDFRNAYDLNISENTIQKILENNVDTELEKIIGYPLLPEEESKITQIDKLNKQADILQEELSKNNIVHSGVYIRDNKIVLKVLDKPDTVLSQITQYIENPDVLEIETAKYSLDDLVRNKNKLNENIELLNQAGVQASGIDIINNKVKVYIEKLTDENRKIVESIIDSDMIEFIEAKIILQDQGIPLGKKVIEPLVSLRDCAAGVYAKINKKM